MDSLKRNGFWIVCGILLAACAGAYAWVLLGIQGEAALTEVALGENLTKIQEYLLMPKDLHGPEETKVLVQRAADLRKELDACKEALRGPKRWIGGPWSPTEGAWTTEKLNFFCENKESYKADFKDKKKLLNETYKDILNQSSLSALDIPDDPDTQNEEKTREGAKKLILLRELLQILKECDVAQVRSLGFQQGAPRSGSGVEGASAVTLSVRPREWTPERHSYPFRLEADMDLNVLPVLLDRLRASSFNLVLEGLHLEKLQDKEQEALEASGRLQAARSNEVVRVTLIAEAYEFLFAEGAPK